MKKDTTITKLFGITQLDMATILGVSRSQWSMFESGKRDLPIAAAQMLVEILSHTNVSEPVVEITNPERKIQLEKLLHENDYQQKLIARKITTATKMQDAGARRQSLIAFLKTKGKHLPVSKTERKNFTSELIMLEVKQQILIFEKQWLEVELHKLNTL